MNKRKIVLDLRNKIGEEYFRLLNVYSIINLMCDEIENEKVQEQLERFKTVIEQECEKILSEDCE